MKPKSKSKRSLSICFLFISSVLLINANTGQAKPSEYDLDVASAILVDQYFIEGPTRVYTGTMYHFYMVRCQIWENDLYWMNQTFTWMANRKDWTWVPTPGCDVQKGTAHGKLIVYIELKQLGMSGTFEGTFNVKFDGWGTTFIRKQVAQGIDGDFVGMKFESIYAHDYLSEIIFDPHGQI